MKKTFQDIDSPGQFDDFRGRKGVKLVPKKCGAINRQKSSIFGAENHQIAPENLYAFEHCQSELKT